MRLLSWRVGLVLIAAGFDFALSGANYSQKAAIGR